MTHWIVEIDVWKSRPSVGIATLTIVASRMAMIDPITTTAPSCRSSRSRPWLSGCSADSIVDAWLISQPPFPVVT